MIPETLSFTKEEIEQYHQIYKDKRNEVIGGYTIQGSFQMTASIEDKLSPFYDPTSEKYSLLQQGNVLRECYQWDAFLRGKYNIAKAYL